MKKSLSQAIAAVTLLGAASAASAAININHGGEGQALLFPYYTVETPTGSDSANYTAIHLTNATDEFKAVKVRFRRYTDSADVLDFNLYLSPQDMWTGAVVAGADGQPALVSYDNSCISNFPEGLASKGAAGQPFLGTVTGPGKYDKADMKKGHIEVIEMASWTSTKYDKFGNVIGVPGTADSALVDGAAVTVADAVEHVVNADGERVPGNCLAIRDSWNVTGYWGKQYGIAADAVPANVADAALFFTNKDLGSAPTGGLYGNAYVINPDQAWASSFAPVAVNELYVFGGTEHNHHAPKFELPSLHGSDVTRSDVNAAADQPLNKEILPFNNGMQTKANIAALFNTNGIKSDYTLVGASNASTELVLTFPMKYAKLPAANPYLNAVFYDREEDRVVAELSDFQLSPWLPENVGANNSELKHEVNVVHIGKDGDRNDIGLATQNLNAPFSEGWVDLTFVDANEIPAAAPVIGFTSTVLKNGQTDNGTTNTYALNFPLKTN